MCASGWQIWWQPQEVDYVGDIVKDDMLLWQLDKIWEIMREYVILGVFT